LIDESGSMRKNDPDNMRIEAAKLFVDLIDVLGEGSRVSIVGFGENTNIYIPLTEISGNEEDIKDSINTIKSDQGLTDMKGALIEVKSMLNNRQKQNDTYVILLTDGKLDINDIPLPGREQKAGTTGESRSSDTLDENYNPQLEKESTSGSKDKRSDNNFTVDPLEEEDHEGSSREREEVERIESEEWMTEYLEKYRAELLNICYIYRDDNIRIYPIAFTREANIELLEKVSLITNSGTWKAETALDIRDIFLEIFKDITGGFIITRDQTDNTPFLKEIEVSSYFKDLIVIALKNEYTASSRIALQSPSGGIPEFSDEVVEDDYRIIKIESPESGIWSAEILGDAIIIFQLVRSSILEPTDTFYLSGSGIPVKIELAEAEGSQGEIDLSDFKVTCNVRYPDGEIKKGLELLDNGEGIDEKSNDAIYSYLLEQDDKTGNYEVDFFVQHLPTMTDSAKTAKSIGFEIIDKPPIEIKSDNNPIVGTQTKIHANFQDFSEGDFSFTLKKPDEEVRIGLLYDDGRPENGDLEEGDGIYSNILDDLDILGEYNIEVESINNTEDGKAFSQDQSMSFNKDFKITVFKRSIELNNNIEPIDIDLNITSIHEDKTSVSINDSKIDSEYIETLRLEGGVITVNGNAEKEIRLELVLVEELKPGDYLVRVPLILNEVYEKDIEIEINYSSSIWQKYFLYILIPLVILLTTGVILIVYFFIIRPRYIEHKA
jgi:hypothetical protein